MDEAERHGVIGEMTEFERGWYHAFVSSLWWNALPEDDRGVSKHRVPVDWEREVEDWVITVYSPSGENKPAPHFYMEGELAGDARPIIFDPKKLMATWMELDSEAAISYYQLYTCITRWPPVGLREEWYDSKELEIAVYCTEGDHDFPEGWDVWPGEVVADVVKTMDKHTGKIE